MNAISAYEASSNAMHVRVPHIQAGVCAAYLHAIRSGAVWRLALLLLRRRLPPLQRLPLLPLIPIPAAAATSSASAPTTCPRCCWPIGLAAAAAPVSVCEQVPELLAIPQLLLQLPLVCQREHVVPAGSTP
jgi:hypothetical protein